MTTKLVILDCAQLADLSAATVDQLARECLASRRRGCECRLANATDELVGLIDLVGLAEVLGVEPGRQPEKREQPLCVEEEGEFGNPPT